MNIAYILISTPNDTFYEQTAISVMTLRKVMPDANKLSPLSRHFV